MVHTYKRKYDSVLLVNDHLILSLDDEGFEELVNYF